MSVTNSYDRNVREAVPGEDDFQVERIEVEFALPVYVTPGQFRRLDELLSEICRSPVNTPVNGVHWLAGCGSKPKWSRVDAALLGKRPDPDAPETGEPDWDDSVLHFESAAREAHEGEKERIAKRAQRVKRKGGWWRRLFFIF